MEVIVGTYEEFLLGYKLVRNESVNFVQSFADKSHAGPLKCLAVHGHFVATGATDDRIFLYDMRSRKQTNVSLKQKQHPHLFYYTYYLFVIPFRLFCRMRVPSTHWCLHRTAHICFQAATMDV